MNKKIGKRGKQWDDHEIEIIVEEIQLFPTNLKHAFQQASFKLPGRTPAAVSAYYYSKLKKGTRAITAMATSRGVMTNTKNSARKTSNRVNFLMPFIHEMSYEEKQEIAFKIFQEL